MIPLSLIPDLLSNIHLLAIPLIIRMSFSLLNDMIDLKKEENRKLVRKLFKTWRRKAIPRVKKSCIKWKCEKEIVHNYLVTGNLEKSIKN